MIETVSVRRNGRKLLKARTLGGLWRIAEELKHTDSLEFEYKGVWWKYEDRLPYGRFLFISLDEWSCQVILDWTDEGWEAVHTRYTLTFPGVRGLAWQMQ